MAQEMAHNAGYGVPFVARNLSRRLSSYRRAFRRSSMIGSTERARAAWLSQAFRRSTGASAAGIVLTGPKAFSRSALALALPALTRASSLVRSVTLAA